MFDFLASTFLICLAYCGSDDEKQFIFVFGIITLFIASMIMKPMRKFKSLYLTGLAIYSLIAVFSHSYRVYPESVAFSYKTLVLLTEGFVFFFAGILFLWLIAKYAKRPLVYYVAMGIASIPWLISSIKYGRMSWLLALAIATTIYLFVKKRFLFFSIMINIGLVIILTNFKWLTMKWISRPMAWRGLFDLIKKHPIAGVGFGKVLNPNYMIVDYDKYGYVFKHNDYGDLAACLGIPVAILVVMFFAKIYKGIHGKPISILFLTVVIMPFFQMVMFDCYKASIFLTIFGVCIIKKGGYHGRVYGIVESG